MGLESIGTPALWIGFTVFVLAMLVLDLGVFLAIIVTVLAGAIVASLLRPRKPLLPALPGLTDQPAGSTP